LVTGVQTCALTIYKINAKSDIYSIGVLFWQLSSGYKPFCSENDDKDVQYDAGFAIAIENGKREDIIKGTPVEYSNLYTGKETIYFIIYFKYLFELFFIVSMLVR